MYLANGEPVWSTHKAGLTAHPLGLIHIPSLHTLLVGSHCLAPCYLAGVVALVCC